jgi:hypothetical protein
MQPTVRADARQDHQVLRPIIGSVSVDVMYDLARHEQSPRGLLGT